MFSRILKSARAYISEKPVPETKKSPKLSARIERTMVTPQQAQVQRLAGEALTDEKSPIAKVPTSSAKKRKARMQDGDMSENDEFVTPSSKKRKVLPVRAKGGKSPKSPKAIKDTRPVVEIRAKVIAPEELDFVEEDEEVEPEVEEPKLPVVTPSKHRRFASEEPEQEFFSTAREELSPVKKDQNETLVILSDDEESDDEAPEAIDIQEAAKTVKSKERQTAQAVKDQLSATRKKRKERDDNFKRQSEMGKKRKVDTSERNEVPGTEDEEEDEDVETEEVADNNTEEESTTIDNSPHYQRKRTGLDLQRNFLPELLPAEYLEDTESRELVRKEPLSSKMSRSKKTKFQDLVDKQPKDKRTGSTIYRVTKVRSTILAPKSAYQARSTKEAWLQGRSTKATGGNRKAFSKGSFRK